MNALFFLRVGWLFGILLALGLVGPSPARAAGAADVELLTDGDQLTPSSTLELRFARDMVKPEMFGVVATASPVVAQPPLAGTFTWLSRRSGVFSPKTEPQMGITYTLSCAPGLADLEGKPIGAAWKAKLRTAAFDVVSGLKPGEDDDQTEPSPGEKVIFNREVELAGAENLFRFVRADGAAIPAEVRYGTKGDYFRIDPDGQPWERWSDAQGTALAKPSDSDDDGESDAVEAPNCLVVKPVAPLSPGGVWRLEMAAGVKARTGGYTIAKARSSILGSVVPFTIHKLTTSSYLNSGRSIAITFSREPDSSLTDDSAAEFFRVEPEVKNLRFEVGYNSLAIHGDFARGQEYRLHIGELLHDRSGLPFSGERSPTVRFGAVKPRVYLPAVTAHQMASGWRKFPITAVNMKSLRVVARLVPREATTQALKAFAAYERTSGGSDETADEKYQALAPSAIPGKIVFDRKIDLPNTTVDQRQETTLDWAEAMGEARQGMIFLTVEGQPLEAAGTTRAGAQALVQLTDLGVLWKTVDRQLRVSVFSMATGQPVPGANVALLSEQQAALGGSRTDAAGSATLPLGPNLAWLTIRRGSDTHTIRMGDSATELPMVAFRLPIWYETWWDETWETKKVAAPKLRALLFTDRPLYHLGETAHLKGIVRVSTQNGLEFFASQTGSLILKLPNGRGLNHLEVRTDEHGAFDLDLPLSDAIAGRYEAALSFGEEGSSQGDGLETSFLAGDYQPNAFAVKIALPKRLAPGAETVAGVRGEYYFGAPLAKGLARWTLQDRMMEMPVEGFEEFQFGALNSPEQKTLTLRGEEALGAAGATIHPRLPEAKGSPHQAILTVEVTDENQQTVSETHSFSRDASSFYLGLKTTEGGVIGRQESIGALAIAVRPDGTPLPEPATVKAELIRIRYETVRAQAAGPSVAFRTTRLEEVVETKEGKTLIPLRAGANWILPPGETARFQPGRGGEYLLRLSARDAEGRAVVAESSFSVSGSEPIAWDYHHPGQVELVADKADYHPGDTARLLIKTPISGEAIVTIERDTQILRTLRVRLEGNAPMIEVPLTAEDAPNVFVSLMLIRGAEQSTRRIKAPDYRYGVCRLHVTNPATHLAVQITPRLPKVQPGEMIETEIAVREANGQPAAGAEVTFFAADEGVLALTGYELPRPHEIFERPFSLKIRTGLSLFELLPEQEDPDAIGEAPGNKGYLIGGGGMGGPGPKPRSEFPGTACWQPKLRTDAAGKVLVRFPAPDALTSYRLVAVAHAGTNRFGTAESNVAISKAVIILSGLGQFAHKGDEIVARAVVRNESGAPGTATITLNLDEKANAGPQSLTLHVDLVTAKFDLAAGASRTVDFPVRLTATGAAQWKWSAYLETDGGKFEDALIAKVNVVSPAPILRETYLPVLREKENDLLAGVNPQLLDGQGNVRVSLSNTRLASLRETSQELLEYPYGCAEQVISSMIPWIVARDFGPIMPDLADAKASKAAIEAGLEKLEAMKTGSGALAYWPGGREANLFVNAYAVLLIGMLEKQEPGAVDSEWKEQLLKYLSAELREMNRRDRRVFLEDYALALYALAAAGKPEPAYHETLFTRRSELSREGRALLACAMMESKGSTAAIAKLLDPREPADECACWFGSATRERATSLLAWVRFKPTDREVARLTQELLGARVHGHWRTTQENAWALLALSQYFARVEHEVKPVAGTLVRAAEQTPFALTTKTLTRQTEFDFSPQDALGPLRVMNPKKLPLYGDVKFIVEPPVALQPRQNRGYDVTRTYYKLGADGALDEAKDLQVGDRIVVVLRLQTTVPGHFVAIDDPLPAIFEAVNPEFQSQAVGGAGGLANDWHADYREMRAERVLYFCDHLPPGEFTFRYLARVRSAGEVIAPSTNVIEMYRPERFGLGASTKITSAAR